MEIYINYLLIDILNQRIYQYLFAIYPSKASFQSQPLIQPTCHRVRRWEAGGTVVFINSIFLGAESI